MRISVAIVAADTAVSNDFIPLEVFPDMSLDHVKGFIESEINIKPSAQTYIINDQIVTQTSRSLTELGVKDGDIVSLAIQTRPRNQARQTQGEPSQPRPAQQQQQQQQQLDQADPETIRLQIIGNADILRDLRNSDSELASAVNDSQRFAQIFNERMRQRHDAQREKERMIAQLEADPFDVEAQQKIEEMIRQERVMENMQKAYEENPESFAHVTMLYIDVLVNNVPIKAFVDSGAQTTIMSPDAAERCGIMRLIDKRFSGTARGVGTAPILGRVHSAEIQIGQYNLASSFTVMAGKDVDLLLGLDMLKRHQMCIDLKENCLRIADDKIRFLPENEIPKMMERINENEPKVQGPGGTTIGTETGTVEAPKSTASSQPISPPGQSSGSKINIHPIGSAGNVGSNRGPAAGSSNTQAPAPAPAQRSAADNPFGATAPITEQSIAQITELGFSREEALAALRQVGGNVELAIGLLL